jgi:hypothetical protein
MRLVIGIDEAGYGPNLGPLVVAASVWAVEGFGIEAGLAPFYPEFRDAPWSAESPWVPLGDSKKIHRRGEASDALLEGGAFLMGTRDPAAPSSWSEILPRVAPLDLPRVESRPWYDAAWIEPVPSAARDASMPHRKAAERKLRALGIAFHGFHARILDELEFNRAVALAGDNKANALAKWSLGLARDALLAVPALQRACDAIEIYCDRLGGRKRYAPLLMQTWHEPSADETKTASAMWFEVLHESSQCSRYRSMWGAMPLSIQFAVDGDSLFPSAAASMLAKGIRESLMGRLNRFWQEQVGDHLKPTAGYAVDAGRFADEIAAARAKLGILEEQWWRMR